MKDVFAFIRGLLPSDTLPPPEQFEGPYRVFTHDHDLELRGDEVESVISQFPHWSYYPSPDFGAYYEVHSIPLDRLPPNHAAMNDCAVSILLDHSGSLRGDKICLVALLAGATSAYLSGFGIRHEILGFTTSSWKGGASAQQWREAGRPNAPGRLCDVLHVIHRSFDESEPLSLESLRTMTQSGLLKENIDGEALEWGTARLEAIDAKRKILIVVSDGAPVDDSTLLHNGPNILDDHLRLVTSEFSGKDVELYGVGIDYKMHRYYPQYVVLSDPSDIQSLYFPILSVILGSDVLAPTALQLETKDNRPFV